VGSIENCIGVNERRSHYSTYIDMLTAIGKLYSCYSTQPMEATKTRISSRNAQCHDPGSLAKQSGPPPRSTITREKSPRLRCDKSSPRRTAPGFGIERKRGDSQLSARIRLALETANRSWLSANSTALLDRGRTVFAGNHQVPWVGQ
jgi:hypothetical protein